MERVGGRGGKNGRTLFDRPKPTVGCSANGRRRRRRRRRRCGESVIYYRVQKNITNYYKIPFYYYSNRLYIEVSQGESLTSVFKNIYFIISLLFHCVTFPYRTLFLNLIAFIWFVIVKLWSSSISNSSQPPVTFCTLDPYTHAVFLSVTSSNILLPYYSHRASVNTSVQYKVMCENTVVIRTT